MRDSAPPENRSTHQLLEITLISAQGLKPPATALRRLQTYAVAWVDPNAKLRTRIDRIGSQNPTWNDTFIFRVDFDFLVGDTSAVCVDIFSVGVLKDHLLGSVRFLISTALSPATVVGTPAFVAVQIRRPSGRFQGILNVGVTVIDGSGLESLAGASAIGYRDLMGKNLSNQRMRHLRGLSDMSSGSESCGGESVDFSDEAESTTSTSSSAASSTVMKEMNGFEQRELAGKEAVILCGLGFQKKIHLSPSDQLIKAFESLDLKTTRSTAQI